MLGTYLLTTDLTLAVDGIDVVEDILCCVGRSGSEP